MVQIRELRCRGCGAQNWSLPGTGDYPETCEVCGASLAVPPIVAGGQGRNAAQVYREAQVGAALLLLVVLAVVVAMYMGCGLVRHRVTQHEPETKVSLGEK